MTELHPHRPRPRLPHARRRSESGTTLLLFPAGFLVVLLLAAVAVDLSTLHLARRELQRSLAVAADDGASMVDEASLRRTGRVTLDPEAAQRVVRFELAIAPLPGRLVGKPLVTVDPTAGTVAIEATVEVQPFLGRTAGRSAERITARATGRLVDRP